MSKIDLASGESSLLELSRAPKIFEAKASEIDLAGVQTDFLRPFGSKRPEVERKSGCGEYQDFRIRFAVLLSITNAYIRSGRILAFLR